MTDYSKTVKAAVVQAESVWGDVDGGIDKLIALAKQGKDGGAEIVAFPETWLPGYPWFVWLDSVAWQTQYIVQYASQSIEIGDERWQRILDAAREIGITIAFGFSERQGGSLYMAQAVIDADGTPVLVRRKLKPTHVERTQFGDGDGSDIVVVDSSVGRVGSLNCWEHLQPLTKYAMFAQDEQLHIGAWPSFSIFTGAAFALGPEVNTGASRQYAVEGQCFVLAPCGMIGEAGQAHFADTDMKKQFLALGGGYSRIYGPDGRELAEPLAPTEEGILYADLDYAMILAAKNAADPVGHYSRPDVFTLHVEAAGRLPRIWRIAPEHAPVAEAPSPSVAAVEAAPASAESEAESEAEPESVGA